MSGPAVYRKHNSFAAMRHRGRPDALLDRLARVRQTLDASGLTADRRAIVAAACDALLAPAEGQAFTLHSYVQDELARLPDDQLPRYLWYRYRYELFPQCKQLDAFPPCLQIEPTSICNYRCVFCYQTDVTFTKAGSGHMGLMALPLFQRIVDQAQDQCEALTLASRGEPLVHKQLEEMLAYVRGKFLALKLNTNASLLTEPLCHAILQADLNTLVFSVDAVAEPGYSQLRVGGDLDRVVANILRFRDIRARHYSGARTITRVSGVQVPGSSGIDEMERFWHDAVDQVALVTYNPWENTYERPLNDVGAPCSDLWRRMFVWWNGVVNPCDVDYRSTLAVGDATRTPLTEIWRGEAYERLRAEHLAARRSQVSPCNRCTLV